MTHVPPLRVPQALCDGAGLAACESCGHCRDQYPPGTESQVPDYDAARIVRDGRCRWWMAAPGRAGMTP